MSQLVFDEETAPKLELMYQARDVLRRRALVRDALAAQPGGRVVIWDVDWATLSMYSADVERMERAKEAFDKHLAHPALPQRLSALLRAAGFEDVTMEGHVFATNTIDPQSYLCMGLPLFVEFIGSQEEFGPDAAKAWEEEQRELGQRGEFYGSVTQFCFSARRPE